VQVIQEEHRAELSAHLDAVTTQLAQQHQAARAELAAATAGHRVLLQVILGTTSLVS
jgi:hypothetical protein